LVCCRVPYCMSTIAVVNNIPRAIFVVSIDVILSI
jgi:hypothetical protein